MTTPRIRSVVSLAAALIVTLMVGGCASAAPRVASASVELPITIRFDNEAREYVHVYLIGTRQEWLLGRVGPGARASLRIPEAALTEDAGLLSLAVIAGDRVTLRVARQVAAATTIAQPAMEMLAQRWTFSTLTASGQLTSLRLARSPAEVVRP